MNEVLPESLVPTLRLPLMSVVVGGWQVLRCGSEEIILESFWSLGINQQQESHLARAMRSRYLRNGANAPLAFCSARGRMC